MECIRGDAEELFAAALRGTTDPVVTLPSAGLCYLFCRAMDRVEDCEARVVIASNEVDNLDWRTQSLAAEFRFDGRLGVREGRATDTAVVGTDRAYALDFTTRPPTAVGSGLDSQVTHRQRWALSERVFFDTPPRAQLIERTAEAVGETAAEVVRAEFARAPTRRRGADGVDPVKLLVWAGAAEEARVTSVKEVVRDLSLGSRQMLERRLEQLQTEELVATPPYHNGLRGRPERQLVVSEGVWVDEPVQPPTWVRAALV
ncbi:MAG: hypothetical protein J07HB67_01568 [halophilic archaeon J07HB67]|jgi:hypothetical protein|nr:MAG: hypothetical protein J07HB67_01568 [halophilic archaeon J07HB67]